MNLIEGIFAEIARVRQIIPMYEQITAMGHNGEFGKALILATVSIAESAISNGDTIAMMEAYEALKEIKE